MRKKIKNINIINPGSPPDVDTDFHTEGRQKVIEYVINKYGAKKVASIITPGPFKSKNAWKSMCTIYGVPFATANKISQYLPADDKISDALDPNSKYYDEYADLRMETSSPELTNVLKKASMLDGRMRETGVHACGIVISSEELSNTIPMQMREDGLPITQWNYHDCEALGLIKMDFLGLDTIDLIDNAVKNVEYTQGKKINMEDIIYGDLNDKKVFELFQKAETIGIFQFPNDGVRELLKKVKPTEFEDLAAITALYRPGPMGLNLHLDYAQRKNDPSARIPVHKKFIGTDLEKILEPTKGSLIYQENVMNISKNCAGFSVQEADKLRKAIGKKKMDLMISLGDKFKKGMIKNGYDKDAVDVLWDGIVAFGSYAFNLSHACSYALNSYQSAYLKVHYPVEFMAALLKQKINDKDISLYVEEAKKMGISFMPPNINESSDTITPSKKGKTILYGLFGIKRMNFDIAHAILEERTKNGQFKDIFDFTKRMNGIIKPGTLQILAKAGCFDCFGLSRKGVFDKAHKLIKAANDKPVNSVSLFDLANIQTEDIPPVKLTDEDWDYLDKAKNEADVTSMFLSCHPLDFVKQEEINLNELSKNIKTKVVFSDIKIKKDRYKNSYYYITLDNKISKRIIKLNKKTVARINKKKILKKTNNDYEKAAQLAGFKNVEEFKKLRELEPLEENLVYEVDITYRTWTNSAQGKVEIVTLENYKKVDLASDGRLINKIYVKDKEKQTFYINKLNETKGDDIVRLIYSNNEYIDIFDVKFNPGTTQYDLGV